MPRLLAYSVRLSLVLRHPSVHRPGQPISYRSLDNQTREGHTEQCRDGLAT